MKNGIAPQVSEAGVQFKVWAPKPGKVELFLPAQEKVIPMQRTGDYWETFAEGAGPGTKYFYRLDGEFDRGDPASRLQPEGVHGPSEVIDGMFSWTDQAWRGVALEDYVLYELHVGTFTPEGTFEGIIPHLPRLKELGVTAVELMPIAQFPGTRNWGYDGVYPFAVQASYGGVAGLKRLVDAAHELEMAVVLDVVYNHLGPEGNYLGQYGPYFTDAYETPWGQAVNLDGEYSDPVREYFLTNLEYWIRECHLDGLRLDACHELFDSSALHILEELQTRANDLGVELGRAIYLFAESDANDPRYVRDQQTGGYGLSCQWLDDYHHSLYTLLDGANNKRYIKDYFSTEHLAKAYAEGFVYSGEYCPTRKKRHGRSSKEIAGNRFVVFIQNHDQVGNRPLGERLSVEVSQESYKLAAGAVILSPYLPLLFMGEEYGETAPFLFFTDHGDQDLITNMVEGRKKEFASDCNACELPNPQEMSTFDRSILQHERTSEPQGQLLQEYYRTLLQLRREEPALKSLRKEDVEVFAVDASLLALKRKHESGRDCLVVMNFGKDSRDFAPPEEGKWQKLLDSADEKWRPSTASHERSSERRHTEIRGESIQLYIAG